MLTIKFNGQNYNLKNSIKELTVGEFEEVLIILNKEDNVINKWFEIFILLGLTEQIINHINLDEFKILVREFEFNTSNSLIKKSIKLNGIEYKAYNKKFILTVKDIIMIENYILINPNKYIAEVIAILYTNDDEKLTHTRIKEKAELIRKEIPSMVAIPIINLLTKTFFANLKTKLDE